MDLQIPGPLLGRSEVNENKAMDDLEREGHGLSDGEMVYENRRQDYILWLV